MLLYNDITILIIQYCMKKCFGLIGVLNIYLMYVYFYLLKVKGFIAITLSVDLSVQMCSVHFFYYVENWKFLQGRKSAKFVSDLYLFYREKLLFFFTPRLLWSKCVSLLWPWSYGLVQCHWKENCVSVSGPYFLMENHANIILHKTFLRLKGMSWLCFDIKVIEKSISFVSTL